MQAIQVTPLRRILLPTSPSALLSSHLLYSSLGNQVPARENRRLCSKFHILCFQTYTIFKAQALLNIELGPKMIQFKIQFKTKSGILIPKRYSFKRVQNIQQNYSFTKNEGTCSTFQIEAKIWFEARPVINLAIFHGKYMQPGRRQSFPQIILQTLQLMCALRIAIG